MTDASAEYGVGQELGASLKYQPSTQSNAIGLAPVLTVARLYPRDKKENGLCSPSYLLDVNAA